MLHVKLIKEVDDLRTKAYPPPHALMEAVENADRRGERWWVLLAFERFSAHAIWVAGFPEANAARYFVDGDQLTGRWDSEHDLFIPEEGRPLDLRGRAVSLAAIEDEEEAEDAEYREGRR